MPEVINVAEFKQDGFAIVEDTAGKFLFKKDSPEIIPLEDKKTLVQFFARREPCALLQSRSRMLT
jgi:hypothetical protein